MRQFGGCYKIAVMILTRLPDKGAGAACRIRLFRCERFSAQPSQNLIRLT